MNKNKSCIIVDGLSTGKHLAPNLNKYGYSCYHIFSKPNLKPFLTKTFIQEDYVKSFIYKDSDYDTLLKYFQEKECANGYSWN